LSQSIQSRLQSRNVTIAGHRTSVRLEGDTWSALEEICQREQKTIHEITTLIENQRSDSSRTAAVRAYILNYFRAAATDAGHSQAGHGTWHQVNRKSVISGKNRVNTEIRIEL